MSISGSRRKRLPRLLLGLAILGLAAWILYIAQNSFGASGGAIAPVKTLWILTVIVFWYLLPVFWALDATLSHRARAVFAIFATNMLLRAIVELWMMYISDSWKHSYGIGHDIISFLLCLALAVLVRREEKWISVFFAYCAVLFVSETIFATYLRNVTGADGSVFFLPSSEAHNSIMIATGVVVVVSGIVGYGLIRTWTNATPSFANPGN